MGKRNSSEQFSVSYHAIKEYIHSNESYWGNHVAKIAVMQNNNMIFNEELSIISLIETNDAFVDIIWPKKWKIFIMENILVGIKCLNTMMAF